MIFQAKYGSDHLTIAENLQQTGSILEKLADISNIEHHSVEALELLAEALRISKDTCILCPSISDDHAPPTPHLFYVLF